MDAVIAVLPSISHAGGGGGIAATLPVPSSKTAHIGQVSAQIGNVQFEGDFEIWANIEGRLPDAGFKGAFGVECFLAADLPLAEMSIPTGGVLKEDLPYMSLTGEIKKEYQGDLKGKLPLAIIKAVAGGFIKAKAPVATIALTGSTVSLQEGYGAIAGKLPALNSDTSSTVLTQTGSVAGHISSLEYAGTGTKAWTGTLQAGLPALLGKVTFATSSSGKLDGIIPPINFNGNIIGDYYFNLSGTLPPLKIGVSSRIVAEPGSENTTVSSDDIIRHRRGYDNG